MLRPYGTRRATMIVRGITRPIAIPDIVRGVTRPIAIPDIVRGVTRPIASP